MNHPHCPTHHRPLIREGLKMPFDRKHYPIDEREGRSLVDVYVRLENWKTPIFMGGFPSFDWAGKFMLDCRTDDRAQDLEKYNPIYTARVNLPKLNPIHVTHRDNYGDSATVWIRLPGIWTEEQARKFWYESERDPDGTFCQHEFDCCGRMYNDSLRVKSNGHSTLLTQYFYRNV